MSNTYKLNRTCPTCGKSISDKNKSGYCNRHRDRTGTNNPFYGKTHSQETINSIKEKCKITSTKLWEDHEYAKRVKEGLKSEKNKLAHTSEEFRKTQSEHAKQQMKNPVQREIRSNTMKANWENNLIEWHVHRGPNYSKEELRFGDLLREALGDNSSKLITKFKLERDDYPKHYWCPDFKYENYIIEFDGDYWHAKGYADSEIVHHNLTAKEIREHDEMKNVAYRKAGFSVIRVWLSEFKQDPLACVNRVLSIITS